MLDAGLAVIPRPPTEIEMPGIGIWFTALGAVPLVIVLGIAIRHLLVGKGPLLLVCLLGGLAASLYEPFNDVLGLVYLPEIGAIGTFTILDRTMPLFVPVIYPWYVGGLAYVAYRRFERGIDRREVFELLGVFVLIDYILELPAVLTDVYTYYGNQPFNFWGHPMWWGFIHALAALIAGATIYKLRPHFRSPASLAGVIPLMFLAYGSASAGAGWPIFGVLNYGEVSLVWTYAAALVTIGLAVYCTWIISLFVTRRPDGSEPGQPKRGTDVGSGPQAPPAAVGADPAPSRHG